MNQPDWIAVDWGTTRLRTWAMTDDGASLDSAVSTAGLSALRPDQFEAALLDVIDPWLVEGRATPVIACGMVGAKQGWAEAAYMPVPVKPDAQTFAAPSPKDPRILMAIAPGVSQKTPPDVMRGEETQIAGFLSRHPEFDGVLCLPGTHTKWALISAQEVVGFVTFMTGELFALLSESSVLKHSVQTDAWDEVAFAEAVADGISKPQHMAARLFGLRAAALLEDLGPSTAKSRLSGTLIGIELAAARAYWLGQNVAIIGDAALANHYQLALNAQGVTASVAPAEDMTLAGLTAAYKTWKSAT